MIDNSQNLSDAALYNLSGGSVLADEVNQTTKSGSENIAVTGSGGVTATITQFGADAARVVTDSIKALENVTIKNLQTRTDKNLLGEEVADVTPADKTRVYMIIAAGVGLGLGLVFFIGTKGKR